MINLLAGARRQPLWATSRLAPPVIPATGTHLLTKGEVMVKWGTEEILRPPMGQKPGGKWKHWGLPHFQQTQTLARVTIMFSKVCTLGGKRR